MRIINKEFVCFLVSLYIGINPGMRDNNNVCLFGIPLSNFSKPWRKPHQERNSNIYDCLFFYQSVYNTIESKMDLCKGNNDLIKVFSQHLFPILRSRPIISPDIIYVIIPGKIFI